MSEPTAAAPTAPPAAASATPAASEIRDRLDGVPPGAPGYRALMAEYEAALTTEATAPPRALVISPTATPAEIGQQIMATRDKLITLDKGSPEYTRLFADYMALINSDATEAEAPADVTTTPIADEDRAAADALTRAYADMLPPGRTWDVPVVAELRAVTRDAFGEDGDKTLQGGLHAATAALREIAATGRPAPAQTEAALRTRWGSDYDREMDAGLRGVGVRAARRAKDAHRERRAVRGALRRVHGRGGPQAVHRAGRR